jgi:glyoxylate reductase
MNWRVFVTRRIPEDGVELLRRQGVAVEVAGSDLPIPRDGLIASAGDCDGLLAMSNDVLDAGVFDSCPKLKVVSIFAAGYENIDVAEATRRRIAVATTPDAVTDATADLTWALILAVARRVVEGDRVARSGEWTGWTPTFMRGTDVANKTIGIVGAGHIGTAVAQRAAGFSMRILYAARSVHTEIERLGAKRVSLPELLRESDFVVVTVPLTPETRGMFGEAQFRQMKPTAFFINTSRGAVQDEAALVRALREGWIAGAGLDVYENEPHLHPELPKLANTVLLPHLGSATVEARRQMSLTAAENLLAVLRGEKCPHAVNPEVFQTT